MEIITTERIFLLNYDLSSLQKTRLICMNLFSVGHKFKLKFEIS
jgi:hypothetical protein